MNKVQLNNIHGMETDEVGICLPEYCIWPKWERTFPLTDIIPNFLVCLKSGIG
jgi:hypothetical protein